MHDQRPPGITGEYQEPPKPGAPPRSGWQRSAGSIAVAVALFAAKFKSIFALLLGFKWLLIGGKFALSFGTIFASIWFYALLFGWKLGVIFVLLILAHEMGHWVVLRNFGIPVSLPYFIPGLGAFVAQKGMSANSFQDAMAALAGPVVGVAASAMCYAFGIATQSTFWIVAAHIGFLLNLFNLIPVLPFDGGRVAGTIDPRLWLLGVAVFVAYILWYFSQAGLEHPIAWLFLITILVLTVPRARAAWRGVVDPRVAATLPAVRRTIALAYFTTIAITTFAAVATNVPT
jgi:Zn-dependent protease